MGNLREDRRPSTAEIHGEPVGTSQADHASPLCEMTRVPTGSRPRERPPRLERAPRGAARPHPLRPPRGLTRQGLDRTPGKPRSHPAHRGARLRDAGGPSPVGRGPRSRLRALPPRLDLHHRDLDLHDDRGQRPLRDPAPRVRAHERRPAHPSTDHRVLLRIAARSPRRPGHPGRHHLADAPDGGVQPGARRHARSRRRHRTGRVRPTRPADHNPVESERPAGRAPRRDGRTPGAATRAPHPGAAGGDGRRPPGPARSLAAGRGLRPDLRTRPIRNGELPLGTTGRRHSRARQRLRSHRSRPTAPRHRPRHPPPRRTRRTRTAPRHR